MKALKMIRRSHTPGRSGNWYNHFGKPPGMHHIKAIHKPPCGIYLYLWVSTRGSFAHSLGNTGKFVESLLIVTTWEMLLVYSG